MSAAEACPDAGQLRDYALGRLDEDNHRTIDGHLASCDTCLERVRNLQKGRGATRSGEPDDGTAATHARPLAVEPVSGSGFGFLDPPRADGEIGRLAGYTVHKLLGQGGMGIVFQAEDPRLKRTVALKVLQPRLAEDLEYHERFLREGRAAAALQNDHIVRIYQAGEANGIPFLAMEFLDGESLDHLKEERRPISLFQAVRWAKEIALGLAAAHDLGLIHRDIKPANIWLESPGQRVKILDFGLARTACDELHLTQTGIIVGTPAYMSPEQAKGEPLDARSDLFSLGSVLYEMLSGQQPFQGPNITAVLSALLVAKPRPLSEICAHIPRSLEKLVRQLLAKAPDARPESAREVADRLGRIEQEIQDAGAAAIAVVPGQAAAPPKSERPSGQKGSKRRGKKSSRVVKVQPATRVSHLVIVAIAMLCAVATGAGLMIWFRPPPPPFDAREGGDMPRREGGPPPWGRGPPPREGDLWRPGEPVPPGWPKDRPMPDGWRHGDPLPQEELPVERRGQATRRRPPAWEGPPPEERSKGDKGKADRPDPAEPRPPL
jgi:serine/threonine protein kinase